MTDKEICNEYADRELSIKNLAKAIKISSWTIAIVLKRNNAVRQKGKHNQPIKFEEDLSRQFKYLTDSNINFETEIKTKVCN